ncbi:unnamed protein product [Brassicogethes aeneus]|uniref:C2H2-type domain-containing protein n=1 Tax=Brassicogethes aeneus TaxID=1431903 RepID=A0A9P0ARN9_BRAAE|nr:unnamed protein product [Brassicogethes aeneus]
MASTNFKCDICQKCFASNGNLRRHNKTHENDIVESKEFLIWLQQEEKENNIRFIKQRGVKRCKQRIVSEEKRQRSQKSQGSSKCDCTCQIAEKIENSSKKCYIQYTSTHYGHNNEIQHLRISKQCRKEVAQKLLIGVSTTR